MGKRSNILGPLVLLVMLIVIGRIFLQTNLVDVPSYDLKCVGMDFFLFGGSIMQYHKSLIIIGRKWTHASKRAVNLDYLPFLRDALVQPLSLQGVNGVQEAVETMDAYYLLKEDVDCIMEINSWGGRPDPFSELDPKVKAAFTHTYNNEAHLTPYALQAIKKLKYRSGAGLSLDSELNEDLLTEDVQADEAEDNLEMDGMIKILLDMLRIPSILMRKSVDTGSPSNTHKTLEELIRLSSIYRNE